MTATPTWSTEYLPPRTGELLPESLPPRPDDTDSLAAFQSSSYTWVWPDVGAEHLVVTDRVVERWAGGGAIGSNGYRLHYAGAQDRPRDSSADPWPFYSAAMVWWALEVVATASAVVRVEESTEPPMQWGICPLYIESGASVELGSWRRIKDHPDQLDSADLWLWNATRSGGPGPQSERNSGPLLPGALATAQAVWDLAQLYLPLAAAAAEETSPVRGAKPTRRNRWA